MDPEKVISDWIPAAEKGTLLATLIYLQTANNENVCQSAHSNFPHLLVLCP